MATVAESERERHTNEWDSPDKFTAALPYN